MKSETHFMNEVEYGIRASIKVFKNLYKEEKKMKGAKVANFLSKQGKK